MNSLIILFITSTKEVMFSTVSISLLVGLSAGLHKSYWTDFHKIWIEDGSWVKEDLTFGADPDKEFWLTSLTFKNSLRASFVKYKMVLERNEKKFKLLKAY